MHVVPLRLRCSVLTPNCFPKYALHWHGAFRSAKSIVEIRNPALEQIKSLFFGKKISDTPFAQKTHTLYLTSCKQLPVPSPNLLKHTESRNILTGSTSILIVLLGKQQKSALYSSPRQYQSLICYPIILQIAFLFPVSSGSYPNIACLSFSTCLGVRSAVADEKCACLRL